MIRRPLSAPFPYMGGKSRAADEVWKRFGVPDIYVEPFAGSLAVLLANPHPARREVVCDTDGHICLDPATNVLDGDLRYRPIGEFRVGDVVLGFDEHVQQADGRRTPKRYRRWKRSVVTATRRVKKKCFRLTMADGTEMIASADHLWLAGASKAGARGWHWARTNYLAPRSGLGARKDGSTTYILKPVPGRAELTEPDYVDGWLGGTADGEGHLHAGPGLRVGISQVDGPIQDTLVERLRSKGYDFYASRVERDHRQQGNTTYLAGGGQAALRFLIQCRPERLIRKFMDRCDKVSIYGRKHYGVALEKLEPMGEMEVVALETDSHTFIAEGFASHNCNFWRALKHDPEAVARHADYPAIHQDLTARHAYLVQWAADNSDRLSEDPKYFCAEAAGWWVWGISIWVGGGWCTSSRRDTSRPFINNSPGGRGVSAQRVAVPDIRPWTGSGAGISGGRGVSARRLHVPVHDRRSPGAVADDVADWFVALQHRLKRVVVLNRDWMSAVTPTVLADTATGPGERANRCIFLDPPYRTDVRSVGLYRSDVEGSSDATAEKSYRWAVERGGSYRIAYCCHVGDFDVPAGWDVVESGFIGRKRDRESSRDLIMFSPACAASQSLGLLD